MFKRFVVSGTKKDDNLTGADRLDIMFGKNGDDVLDGRGGWDFLFGGKGNDKLFGGDGNDWLLGGKGKDELFGDKGNDKLFGGKGSDFLDGGAGSDYVFGDKGNDTFNFTLSENDGAKDYYDGGKGLDTLQLTLTSAEADAAESEIEAFKEFLADGGKVFHFESLGLTVRNFEDLKLVTVGGNTPPEAMDDTYTLNEDMPLIVVAPGVLGNDDDAEDKPALTVAVGVEPAHGLLNLRPDGSFTYAPELNYNGPDSFTYVVSDGAGGSDTATVDLTVNAVNDDPVAIADSFKELDATVVVGPIRVAVVGTIQSSIEGARDQLLNSTAFDFEATAVPYTNGRNWADLNDDNYDVVVLGENGNTAVSDYAAETATGLFATLSEFVQSGGGVVTTGWFARALPLIDDATAKALADSITPIASDLKHDYAGTAGPSSLITISDSNHAIAGGLPQFQLTTKFGWELAGAIDVDNDPTDMVDTGATLLATGRATVGSTTTPLPAIAYNDAVGMGKTAYLGGFYLADSVFSPELTRSGDLDAIFERAVAWVAGGGGASTASVSIDPSALLANDTDVDSPLDDFTFDSFTQPGADGASIVYVNGNLVYTLGAQSLLDLQAGLIVEDSFEYTMSDGAGGLDTASVSLSIDTLL